MGQVLATQRFHSLVVRLRMGFPTSRGLLKIIFSICFLSEFDGSFRELQTESSASSSTERSCGSAAFLQRSSTGLSRDRLDYASVQSGTTSDSKQLGSMDLLHSNLQASKKRTVVNSFVGR